MISKSILIKIQTDLQNTYEELNKYIESSEDRGFTEDALSNIEGAINNIDKALK